MLATVWVIAIIAGGFSADHKHYFPTKADCLAVAAMINAKRGHDPDKVFCAPHAVPVRGQ